jgi:hypothetical protein
VSNFFSLIKKILKKILFKEEQNNLIGKIYIYKNIEYKIISNNVKVQEQDVWIDAILYTNESDILFVRSSKEFFSKFKQKRIKK